jgi:bla regulator protein blaR1
LRAGSPVRFDTPIQAMSSPALLEPGVFGVVHPVLLLPEGITERLTPAQLKAILAHELCHIRHHDNLTAAIHMFVETVFWFHPLVWWLGARLVEERERACDEEVLRTGEEPTIYAEGILKVCEFYLESPLACVAGVTGSNLKKRIEAIMMHRTADDLNFGRKLLLAAAGVAAVIGPIVIGLANAPQSRAQSQAAARPEFEVATVKQSPPPAGDLININLGTVRNGIVTFTNASLSDCLKFAYGIVSDAQLSGPDWIKSKAVRFDIVAQAPPDTPREQLLLMVQALLAERLKLTLHHEQKQLPFLALVVGKNGHKMKEAASSGGNPASRGQIAGKQMTMSLLATLLSRFERQTVVDMTNLKGPFEVELVWTPDGAAEHAAGPSIFTAVQEQLGLKLESRKGALDVLVVDSAERTPAEN